jgi:hypothetical protein
MPLLEEKRRDVALSEIILIFATQQTDSVCKLGKPRKLRWEE